MQYDKSVTLQHNLVSYGATYCSRLEFQPFILRSFVISYVVKVIRNKLRTYLTQCSSFSSKPSCLSKRDFYMAHIGIQSIFSFLAITISMVRTVFKDRPQIER